METVREVKLKACPFCGSANVEAESYTKNWDLVSSVWCGDCGAQFESIDSWKTEGATEEGELANRIAEWNRRAGVGGFTAAELKEVVVGLRDYQDWRRGRGKYKWKGKPEPFHLTPKELGVLEDRAIAALEAMAEAIA